jgi:hypothetical protein
VSDGSFLPGSFFFDGRYCVTFFSYDDKKADDLVSTTTDHPPPPQDDNNNNNDRGKSCVVCEHDEVEEKIRYRKVSPDYLSVKYEHPNYYYFYYYRHALGE